MFKRKTICYSTFEMYEQNFFKILRFERHLDVRKNDWSTIR